MHVLSIRGRYLGRSAGRSGRRKQHVKMKIRYVPNKCVAVSPGLGAIPRITLRVDPDIHAEITAISRRFKPGTAFQGIPRVRSHWGRHLGTVAAHRGTCPNRCGEKFRSACHASLGLPRKAGAIGIARTDKPNPRHFGTSSAPAKTQIKQIFN